MVKRGLSSFTLSTWGGFLVLCSVTASFFTGKMRVSLMFQKIDGPGPPLGNSLKRRIRNHHLILGVETLRLHAESAEGGPGGVPVRVLAQQTLTALSCQHGGSIIFSLKSLRCVCTYSSLHYNGPVNVCCSRGAGRCPCSFIAWAGMHLCFHWQFPPLITLGATFLLKMRLESSSRMRTGSGTDMEMVCTLPSLCHAFPCTKRGNEMRIKPFSSLVNLHFCVRSRVWCVLEGKHWARDDMRCSRADNRTCLSPLIVIPCCSAWGLARMCLSETHIRQQLPGRGGAQAVCYGILSLARPNSKGDFQQCLCQKFSCIIMVRIYFYFCVLRMVWWHKHKSEWEMRWFPSLFCPPKGLRGLGGTGVTQRLCNTSMAFPEIQLKT